jgi:ribokinase
MLDVWAPELVPGEARHAPLRVRPGGSPVNAALAAAAEGARAGVVARVGEDAAGRLIAEAIADGGIEPFLAVDPELPTGTFLQAGSAIVADRGANARLAPDDIPPTLEAGAVLVSGYVLLHDDSRAAARAALERANAGWVAVDVASRDLVGPDFHELAAGVSVLLADDAEARALTGLDPEPAVVELGGRYRLACIKLGADGAVAALDGRVLRGSPPGRLPVGAPGAGDAFAAGLLLGLARNLALDAALDLGCRLGFQAIAESS